MLSEITFDNEICVFTIFLTRNIAPDSALSRTLINFVRVVEVPVHLNFRYLRHMFWRRLSFIITHVAFYVRWDYATSHKKQSENQFDFYISFLLSIASRKKHSLGHWHMLMFSSNAICDEKRNFLSFDILCWCDERFEMETEKWKTFVRFFCVYVREKEGHLCEIVNCGFELKLKLNFQLILAAISGDRNWLILERIEVYFEAEF
jgi:hypothetical protein